QYEKQRNVLLAEYARILQLDEPCDFKRATGLHQSIIDQCLTNSELVQVDSLFYAASVATQTKEWPLIIDPLNLAIKWIKGTIDNKTDFVIVNISSDNNWFDEIELALSKGVLCVLCGITGRHVNMLDMHPIFRKQITSYDNNNIIKLNPSQTISCNESAKIIFITQEQTIPFENWSLVIDFSLSIEYIKRYFAAQSVKNMNDEQLTQTAKETEIIQLKSEIKNLEEDILKEFSSNQFENMQDYVDKLQSRKAIMDEIQAQFELTENNMDSLPEMEFAPIILSNFLNLFKIDCKYYFHINDLAKCLSTTEVNSADNLLSCFLQTNQIIYTAFHYYDLQALILSIGLDIFISKGLCDEEDTLVFLDINRTTKYSATEEQADCTLKRLLADSKIYALSDMLSKQNPEFDLRSEIGEADGGVKLNLSNKDIREAIPSYIEQNLNEIQRLTLIKELDPLKLHNEINSFMYNILNVTAYTLSYPNLRELLHINSNHFIIIKEHYAMCNIGEADLRKLILSYDSQHIPIISLTNYNKSQEVLSTLKQFSNRHVLIENIHLANENVLSLFEQILNHDDSDNPQLLITCPKSFDLKSTIFGNCQLYSCSAIDDINTCALQCALYAFTEQAKSKTLSDLNINRVLMTICLLCSTMRFLNVFFDDIIYDFTDNDFDNWFNSSYYLAEETSDIDIEQILDCINFSFICKQESIRLQRIFIHTLAISIYEIISNKMIVDFYESKDKLQEQINSFNLQQLGNKCLPFKSNCQSIKTDVILKKCQRLRLKQVSITNDIRRLSNTGIIVTKLLEQLPNKINIASTQNLDNDINETLQTVLQQEANRYNSIIDEIRNDLNSIKRLRHVNSSNINDIHDLIQNISQCTVPAEWKSYQLNFTTTDVSQWISNLSNACKHIELHLNQRSLRVFLLTAFSKPDRLIQSLILSMQSSEENTSTEPAFEVNPIKMSQSLQFSTFPWRKLILENIIG
ncbi:hypothetical protein GJ496_005178, partial [Pomphorhynchus laevis]